MAGFFRALSVATWLLDQGFLEDVIWLSSGVINTWVRGCPSALKETIVCPSPKSYWVIFDLFPNLLWKDWQGSIWLQLQRKKWTIFLSGLGLSCLWMTCGETRMDIVGVVCPSWLSLISQQLWHHGSRYHSRLGLGEIVFCNGFPPFPRASSS